MPSYLGQETAKWHYDLPVKLLPPAQRDKSKLAGLFFTLSIALILNVK